MSNEFFYLLIDILEKKNFSMVLYRLIIKIGNKKPPAYLVDFYCYC